MPRLFALAYQPSEVSIIDGRPVLASETLPVVRCLHVTYSRPRIEDEPGRHYDSEGHVTGTLLASPVNNIDAHYFLCGPTRFMTEIQTSLERQAVPAEHIHYETLGPSV